MNHRLGEKGSSAFTVLASISALALTILYVQNSSERTHKTIQTQKVAAENEAIRLNDMPGLSLMRGLLTPARISSTLYEPAIFPNNYFDEKWSMALNDLKPVTSLKVEPSHMMVKTFKTAQPTIEQSAAYFGPSSSRKMTDDISVRNQMTILRLNYYKDHKYYVTSVDVEAKTSLGAGKDKSFPTVGRIPLPPPEPGPARLQIAPAGTQDWTEKFGTAADPLPARLYKLRILASGVVLYGEITGTKGGTLLVGMNEHGITHKAYNIHAHDAVLGETIDLQLGEDKTETKTEEVVEESGELSAHTTHNANCSFTVSGPASAPAKGGITGTTSTTSTSLAATENTIGVKIYRVDGAEAKVGFEQKIYVQSKVTTVTNFASKAGVSTTSGSGGDRCRARCPRDRETIFGQYMEFLELSYLGSADKTKVDVLRRAESDGLPSPGGAICGNLELVAQDLVNDMGGVLPTQINNKPNAQRNWDIVKTHVETDGSSMKLERFYAYIAPACGRELIGFRSGCVCFAEDTRIRMADGSERMALEIRAGDWVYNPKTNRPQKVKRVIAGPEKPLLYIVQVNGTSVKVTEDHPFLTPEGLKPAKRLSSDDLIVDAGQTYPIESISREQRALDQKDPEVWNFELEGSSDESDHYVLANGVMTGDLYLRIQLKQAQ